MRTPNLNYNIMHEEIMRAKNKYMPIKTMKFNKYKHKNSTWITQGLLKSIRYRDTLYKQLKMSDPNSPDYETTNTILKTYNSILKRNIRAAKQIYFESRFNRFKNDIRNTWKTINEILSKNKEKKTSSTIFKENGTSITDKTDIAKKFNNYFTNIGQSIAESIQYKGNKNYDYYLNTQVKSVLKFKNVNEETVRKTINDLPTKNSSGFDGISSKLLKIIEPAIIKSLTLVINQVINTGIFPDKLKIAKVIPIFKNDDSTLFKNYRPISLLPTISKVLEKIIHNQLSAYFIDSKLFFDNQYGFRPNHSTEYASLELVDIIITQMDRNHLPISIFLDLSKAFDTIDHSILLNKLRHYGLDGKTLLLFKSYLNNRKQLTEFDDTTSETSLIKVGVQQGSILGPLLFTIYINDFSQASEMFNFIIYADDTTLFSTIETFRNSVQNKSTESVINEELLKIVEWLNINKLSQNKSKSKYMTFQMPNKTTLTLSLKINNIDIEKVGEFNYLGLTIDTNLNWKKHTEKISNKCSKTIGILNRLKHVLPLEIKIMLYNALILPHIN